MANEHAFFDQLAASMEYANAYDLGTVELQQQKFDDFDRMATLQEKVKAMPASSAAFSMPPTRTAAAPTARPARDRRSSSP